MKRLTIEEWEEKYIVGTPEQPSMAKMVKIRPPVPGEGLSEKAQATDEAKGKPGRMVIDRALARGAVAGYRRLEVLDTSKPNPSQASLEVAKILASSRRFRGFDRGQQPEEKLDTSDLKALTNKVKKAATFFGADLVGVCKLDRRWVYSHTADAPSLMGRPMPGGPPGGPGGEGMPKPPFPMPEGGMPEGMPMPFLKEQVIPEEYQYAIVMAFEMDYNLIKYFPTTLALVPTPMGYSRAAFTSMLLSEFIRGTGYKAINCATNGVAVYPPLGLLAGLGELGRNGLLITPKFGPRVRLSPVFTNLPLVPDAPIEFGVTEFCNVCKKCAELCPSQSLSHGERTAEAIYPSTSTGVLKWPINGETCVEYWMTGGGGCCARCIAVCPYNKVSSWPHRVARWFTDHVRWADPMYVKMDDWLGYGKPKRADNFWEEWNPNPYGHNDYL